MPPPPRRVLVVAYYFPPMGLSGVQRVAKFVKYLPEWGWHPTVLTVEPGGYFAYDEGLLEEVRAAGVEVLRTRSLDPTRLFGRGQTVGLPAEGHRRRLTALSQTVFVPDNKIGWFPFAVRAGRRELRRRTYHALFASAPPYSGLLVGARLSQTSGVPLMVDYRDDWVGNPRHVYPTLVHRRLHEALERWVHRHAASTSAINSVIAKQITRRTDPAGRGGAVAVIPQGFDPADLPSIGQEEGGSGRRLRLTYTGVFYDVQTPDIFLHGLRRLLDRHPLARAHVEAHFVGLFPEASERLVRVLGLSNHVRLHGYQPHDAATDAMASADVLWMTVGRRRGAEQVSTGKLFEYFGTGKPVLGLVPEGAAREALMAYGAGYVADPDDEEAAASALARIWTAWRRGTLPTADEAFMRAHDRKHLAAVLAEHLSRIAWPVRP